MRYTAMEAREPEQQAMMDITTNAWRVGSVLISKSNFIANLLGQHRKQSCNWGEGCRVEKELGELVGGRECRNNQPLW